jgi:tetratricopeptide (TPR) repeat protein
VFAGIGYVVTQSGPQSVLGASGAIAAVTGAYLILFPRSNITVIYFFILIGQFEIASMWFILLFFAMDLLYLSRDTHGVHSGVAHAAHVGGTLFGAVVCFTLLAINLLPRDQFDVVALVKQWNRRRQYRDAVSGGWNPYIGPAPGVRQAEPDPKTTRILDLRSSIAEAIAAHELPRAGALYLELKTVDPEQVLSRQAQLDVANQLAAEQLYPQAAEAYELFLRHYPKFEQIEQIELMLGIIYARYLSQYARARECLVKAQARLQGERELAMAKSELERIAPLVSGQKL